MTKPDKKNANAFELHVAILRRDFDLSLADARSRAWVEGPAGYNARLAEMAMPTTKEEETK